MDWIKAKYDRVILLVAALILIASSVFVALNALSFAENFQNYLAPVSKSNVIKPLASGPITQANQTLTQPARWGLHDGSLFVSEKIMLQGDRIKPFGPDGERIYPNIPNKWFFDYKLDILLPDILDQDADGDRFTNGQEYEGKTDPQDASSHPPFTDKLLLKKFINKPFRIVFSARDDQTCQVNTIDLHQPTQFLHVGDTIAGTKYKLDKLTIKECADRQGTPVDCSELLIRNVDTNEPIILVVGQIGNSPDVFAHFKYLWDNSEFVVKKNGEFQLKPDEKTTYKLIDIAETEAKIKNLATGEEIKIPNAR